MSETNCADYSKEFQLENQLLLHAPPYLNNRIFSPTEEQRIIIIVHIVPTNDSSNMPNTIIRFSKSNSFLYFYFDYIELSCLFS